MFAILKTSRLKKPIERGNSGIKQHKRTLQMKQNDMYGLFSLKHFFYDFTIVTKVTDWWIINNDHIVFYKRLQQR